MLQSVSNSKKILWAIDPLARDKEPQVSVAKTLKALSNSAEFMVLPVAILLEDQIPYLISDDQNQVEVKQNIEMDIKKWLDSLNIKNCEYPVLLIEKNFSVRAGVKLLLRYAKENECSPIIASTHAKNRNQLPALGTFSETLFLISNIPLIMINSRAQISSCFKELFFPFDLSEESFSAVSEVGEIASMLKAHVTVFYKTIDASKSVIDSSIDTPTRKHHRERQYSAQMNELKAVVNSLRAWGLKADLIVDNFDSDYISLNIVGRTNHMDACLIVMVSHTFDWASSLPGSVTRQVLDTTQVPVWLLQPKPGVKENE